MNASPKIAMCDVVFQHTRLLNKVADHMQSMSEALYAAGNHHVSGYLDIHEGTLRRAAKELSEAHTASVGADFNDSINASRTMLQAMLAGVSIGKGKGKRRAKTEVRS